jgi:hypothetical protein
MCWLAYFVVRLYDWWTRAVSGVGVQVIAGSHVCNRPLLIGRIEKLSGVQGSLPFPVDLLLLRATHVDGERPAATGVSSGIRFGRSLARLLRFHINPSIETRKRVRWGEVGTCAVQHRPRSLTSS